MKLKVKLDRESRIVDLYDRTPSSVTLAELKSSVKQLYNLENDSFQLSLNKKDALEDEDKTLIEFGIVSGDLLHLIGPDIPQFIMAGQERRGRPQPLASYSSQVDPDSFSQQASPSSSVSLTEQSLPDTVTFTCSAEDTTNDDATDVKRSKIQIDSADINRFLHEPLVIQESTGTKVPVLLEQLYKSANCTCTADALWVVLHALMLESGFSPNEDIEMTTMPNEYKKAGYYSTAYKYSVSQDIVKVCALVGLELRGTSVAVHAYPKDESNFRTQPVQLKTSDFITYLSPNTPETYRALDKLSRLFMDTISLPLTNELITAAGFPERQGLLALPCMVKLKILSFLGARSLCRLGQTCYEFASMYKDKSLWRLLYIRDFGKPSDTRLNRNWFEIYKEQRIRRNNELEARRRMFHVDATDPPWGFPGGAGPFRPFNPAVPFPRMLGGDYDLHPEFTTGLPVRLPVIPAPGSLNGELNNIDPLLRPSRSNLFGSPFSNNWHQPFM